MKVSIVIPFLGRWELVHNRINELYRFVSDPVEIVLVNDFSQDESIDGAVAWWQQSKIPHSVVYVKNEQNLGFGGSMNKGCSVATGDVLILLSNDVEIHGNIVDTILSEISDEALFGDVLYPTTTGWNVLNINGKQKLFPYLGGHLLACTRSVWDKLGGFDPIYGKFDFEDVCLSTTALFLGMKLVPLRLPVSHMSGQTIRRLNPDRESYTIANRELFRIKWSGLLKDE